MKNQETHTFENIRAYFNHFRYIRTYRQGNKDAYYNFRSNEHVLLPYEEEGSYTGKEILQLFKESKGTELPYEIELCRFKLFIYEQSNTTKS